MISTGEKIGSLSIRAYLVGVLLLAVFIEESAAERNSLEELFLPPFMRYASEEESFGCILDKTMSLLV